MWCAWLYATLREIVVDVEQNNPQHSLRLLVVLLGYTSNTTHSRQWKETVLRFVAQFAGVLPPSADLVRSVYLNTITSSQSLLNVGVDTLVSLAVFCRDIQVRLEVYRSLKLLSDRWETDPGGYLTSALTALDEIFILYQERDEKGVSDARCRDVLEKLMKQYRLEEELGKDFLVI